MLRLNKFFAQGALCLGLAAVNLTVLADANAPTNAAAPAAASQYQRLLPLEGGSNFRDLGGYQTKDGKQVRKGVLFRSGVMTGLTEKDQAYLGQFDFQAVVDFRSDDELALYPNHWVKRDTDIDYRQHSYSMADMMTAAASTQPKGEFKLGDFYYTMPSRLAPQMKLYFEELLEGKGAVVVNCSAGQDRTGFASAVLLSALGVPEKTVEQDYLLSTEYRRPEIERGNVDLQAAAKTNAFARMMLHYSEGGKIKQPEPLLTDDGTPLIRLALGQIKQDYGSVEGYLKQEVGLADADLSRLRQLYLE